MSDGDTEWKTALGTSAMMMMTLLEQEIRQNSGTQLPTFHSKFIHKFNFPENAPLE